MWGCRCIHPTLRQMLGRVGCIILVYEGMMTAVGDAQIHGANLNGNMTNSLYNTVIELCRLLLKISLLFITYCAAYVTGVRIYYSVVSI